MGRFEVIGWFSMLLLIGCTPSPLEENVKLSSLATAPNAIISPVVHTPTYVQVNRNVLMKDYFNYIDSLANYYYPTFALKEYILVNANSWIIDSLRTLDYYQQKKKGIFVYDHSKQIILHDGDSLMIADSALSKLIHHRLQSSRIDINLPEYTLRIIQGSDTVLTCPIRIGRNDSSYLEYYQRKVDLRTPIGDGEIITIRKQPKYIDLQTGEEYIETKRDDGRKTKMPNIPSLTLSINGKIPGTLIHATTNPRSLGKAYSHGCVSTSEPDMWSIYYLSPVGTKVKFRYDLTIKDEQGNWKKLRDVYHLQKD